MTPLQFDRMASLLYSKSGMVITKDKTYLLEARLSPVIRKHGIDSIGTLSDQAQTNPLLANELVEAMTINESSFFRDKIPFEQFSNFLLPSVMKTRNEKKNISIWSAASSSGQEAYSLAILAQEKPIELANWKVDILGTDLSREMVSRAQAGKYTHFEIQRGLPARLLAKYFEKLEKDWEVSSQIKQHVKFLHFNLLSEYNSLPDFDIIFCRNVLIYFDFATKEKIIKKMCAKLRRGGFFVVGGAESCLSFSKLLKMEAGCQGVYRLADG